MAGIRVQLPEELERKFREVAMRRFGYGKGALSKAAVDAFRRWIPLIEKDVEFKGDPIKVIDGILRGIDIDSVELQHLAKKIWAHRHVSR